MESDNQDVSQPLRVLCIDGGGMRGIYPAAYLSELSGHFARRRGIEGLDLGAAFDLIAGTSTGGLIGLALAHGVSATSMLELYRSQGSRIFPKKLPSRLGFQFAWQLLRRPALLRSGEAALRAALEDIFGQTTLGELYSERGIALAIPAVEMANHRGWVFKTPHLPNSFHRDDDYRLVDVGLATSAAPIFRSLAAIDNPSGSGHRVFADGGLFANSPITIALIDALTLAKPGQSVHLFSLGTCKRPPGKIISKRNVHLGLPQWRFGADAVALALDAQDQESWFTAQLLRQHLAPDVRMVRFPQGQLPSGNYHFLDLDDTSDEAAEALMMQAGADVQVTLSLCGSDEDEAGQMINDLMMNAPRSDR